MPNYAYTNPTDHFESGDVIETGNFIQLFPDTPILEGLVLTIKGGNWLNVRAQPYWNIQGGNWAQIDKCSHLNPHLLNYGYTECEKECRHEVSKTPINIDNEIIDIIYEYKDLVL